MRAAAQGAGLSLCRGHWPGLGREVADEPVPGQRGDRVEGARLLRQMAGAGHHRQAVLAAQLGLGPAVEDPAPPRRARRR